MKKYLKVEIVVDDKHPTCCSPRCPFYNHWVMNNESGREEDIECMLFIGKELDVSDLLRHNKKEYKIYRCRECLRATIAED